MSAPSAETSPGSATGSSSPIPPGATSTGGVALTTPPCRAATSPASPPSPASLVGRRSAPTADASAGFVTDFVGTHTAGNGVYGWSGAHDAAVQGRHLTRIPAVAGVSGRPQVGADRRHVAWIRYRRVGAHTAGSGIYRWNGGHDAAMQGRHLTRIPAVAGVPARPQVSAGRYGMRQGDDLRRTGQRRSLSRGQAIAGVVHEDHLDGVYRHARGGGRLARRSGSCGGGPLIF